MDRDDNSRSLPFPKFKSVSEMGYIFGTEKISRYDRFWPLQMYDIKMMFILKKPGHEGMDSGHLLVYLKSSDKLEDVRILVERGWDQDFHQAMFSMDQIIGSMNHFFLLYHPQTILSKYMN